MKRIVLLAVVAAFSMATFSSAVQAEDNKLVKGVKAVGRGILWGPKKICQGINAGYKKITGKS